MRPHIITRPAAHPPTRLAGTDTIETAPKMLPMIGTTANWALTVTLAALANGSGNRSRAWITGPSSRMPADAATES